MYIKQAGVKQGFYTWWKKRKPIVAESLWNLQFATDDVFMPSRRGIDAKNRAGDDPLLAGGDP